MSGALSGQSVIVFGATGRLGRAVCLTIAVQGARVAVHYNTNVTCAEDIALKIKHQGGEALIVGADVTQPQQIEQCMQKVSNTWGRIDSVVNLVHRDKGFEPKNIADMSWENWIPHIEAMKAHFNICHEAIPYMRSQNYGRIVYLSGGLCYRFFEGCAPFSAIKAGVNAFCKTLALEEGRYNITVNIVAPGKIVGFDQQDKTCNAAWSKLEEQQLTTTPLGRHANVQDVSNAILMFLLPGSSFLTGQTLFVAGGEIMPMP